MTVIVHQKVNIYWNMTVIVIKKLIYWNMTVIVHQKVNIYWNMTVIVHQKVNLLKHDSYCSSKS